MKNRIRHLLSPPVSHSAFAAVVRAEARAAARVDDAVANGGGSSAWWLAVRIEAEMVIVADLLHHETRHRTAAGRI